MLVALGQLLGCWVHGDPWEYWLNMESPGLHHGESMKESQNPIFFFYNLPSGSDGSQRSIFLQLALSCLRSEECLAAARPAWT